MLKEDYNTKQSAPMSYFPPSAKDSHECFFFSACVEGESHQKIESEICNHQSKLLHLIIGLNQRSIIINQNTIRVRCFSQILSGLIISSRFCIDVYFDFSNLKTLGKHEVTQRSQSLRWYWMILIYFGWIIWTKFHLWAKFWGPSIEI